MTRTEQSHCDPDLSGEASKRLPSEQSRVSENLAES